MCGDDKEIYYALFTRCHDSIFSNENIHAQLYARVSGLEIRMVGQTVSSLASFAVTIALNRQQATIVLFLEHTGRNSHVINTDLLKRKRYTQYVRQLCKESR